MSTTDHRYPEPEQCRTHPDATMHLVQDWAIPAQQMTEPAVIVYRNACPECEAGHR